MSTAEQVQLKKAGDTLTMKVMSCAKVPTGNFPDYDFTGIDTAKRLVVVRVPESSAKRQLTRLELSFESVVGQTITFSRDANTAQPTKPYWGISLSDAVIPNGNGSAPSKAPNPNAPEIGAPIPGLDDDAPAPEPPDDATAESPAKAKLKAIFKLQEVCFSHAVRLAKEAAKDGVPMTLEGISALTAQSMISANQRGVI